MESLLIPLTACLASLLTFFSGFGLGTLLTPVFALFFPVSVAVVLTAVVHFLNGLFKLILVGRHADRATVLRFGIPAILGALLGAWLLGQLSHFEPLHSYSVGGRLFQIEPVKLVMALLIAFFTLFEIFSSARSLKFDPRYLALGGVLSGLFGGLSGHQGALRSAFLAKAGLTKEQFIATGTVISSLIDAGRIAVYLGVLKAELISAHLGLLTVSTLAAFSGAYLGSRLLSKVTMKRIQWLVSLGLLLLAASLGLGLI